MRGGNPVKFTCGYHEGYNLQTDASGGRLYNLPNTALMDREGANV